MEPIACGEISCSALIQGSGLVLAQLSIAEFVNFPREALLPLRSGWEEIEEQEKEGIGSSMYVKYKKVKLKR